MEASSKENMNGLAIELCVSTTIWLHAKTVEQKHYALYMVHDSLRQETLLWARTKSELNNPDLELLKKKDLVMNSVSKKVHLQ